MLVHQSAFRWGSCWPENADIERLAALALSVLGLSATVLMTTLLALRAVGIELQFGLRGWATALACCAVLLFCWRRRSPSGGDEKLRGIAGLLFILFAAITVDVLICYTGQALALPLVDPWLAAADASLTLDPLAAVASSVTVPGLNAVLGFAYLSSFPLIFGSVLLFAWRGQMRVAWQLTTVFAICLLGSVTGALLFPAAGAFEFLGISAELQAALPPGAGIYHLDTLHALRSSHAVIVDPTHMTGLATFPSFHTAMALMTAAAWVRGHLLGGPMVAWQGLVIASTIPIGGHYFVDLLGGGLCWAAAELICCQVADRSRGVDVIGGEASPSHAYM